GQDDLDDQIVNNRAEGHAQQFERKVMEDAAEDNLADDDGCQADDDGAAAGVDIGKALVLRVKGAGQRDQAVRNHKAQNLVEVYVNALRTAHIRVRAGRADGTAERSTEEPIQQRNDNHSEDDCDHDRVADGKLLDIAQRDQHVV